MSAIKDKLEKLRQLNEDIETLEDEILESFFEQVLPDSAVVLEDLVSNCSAFPSTDALCKVIDTVLEQCIEVKAPKRAPKVGKSKSGMRA